MSASQLIAGVRRACGVRLVGRELSNPGVLIAGAAGRASLDGHVTCGRGGSAPTEATCTRAWMGTCDHGLRSGRNTPSVTWARGLESLRRHGNNRGNRPRPNGKATGARTSLAELGPSNKALQLTKRGLHVGARAFARVHH